MSDNSLTKQGYSNEDAYIKEKEVALRTERDKLYSVRYLYVN